MDFDRGGRKVGDLQPVQRSSTCSNEGIEAGFCIAFTVAVDVHAGDTMGDWC